eukprot:SAG11_NODE_5136_length_1655_cov_1.277635_3_plen_77_part_01
MLRCFMFAYCTAQPARLAFPQLAPAPQLQAFLVELRLAGCGLNDAAIAALAASIYGCLKLALLDLCHNKISNRSIVG